MNEDRVRVGVGADGVATVSMVRADKHNALDQAMFEGLMNAAQQLATDASVRAVVLHGEGKSFCSGLDIASFMTGQGGPDVLLTRDDKRLANFPSATFRNSWITCVLMEHCSDSIASTMSGTSPVPRTAGSISAHSAA